ncbi:MAG: hypothetical protein ACJARZ_002259 [Dokdonia sp.]|jgi:hypothetical protein
MILGALEFWVRNVPSSPKAIATYLHKESENLEVLVLGASQNQGAIHPKFMSWPTINLASGHQDYAEDFAMLSQLKERLPKLNTIILSMTFAHLDTPPNKQEFWKHTTFLNYYNVNAFGRTVYAKDKLLYISNPSFYSKEILGSISPVNVQDYGDYGYFEKAKNSAFAKANYEPTRIKDISLSIYNRENPAAVQENTAAFKKILAFCKDQQLKAVILLTPVTQKHYRNRNPTMVARRDAFLKEMLHTYPDTHLIDAEQVDYLLPDFNNHNHLSPQGAEKFTNTVNQQLKENH